MAEIGHSRRDPGAGRIDEHQETWRHALGYEPASHRPIDHAAEALEQRDALRRVDVHVPGSSRRTVRDDRTVQRVAPPKPQLVRRPVQVHLELKVEQVVRLLRELEGDKPKVESYAYSVSRMLTFALWVLTINQVIQTFLLLKGHR